MRDEQLRNTMKVERARRNLTQADLAGLAGVTRRSINAIESGRMIPSVLLAMKIARALQVTVESLFVLESSSDAEAAEGRASGG